MHGNFYNRSLLFSGHEFMDHMEYPIINEAYRYKQNRYLYGTVQKSDFKTLGNVGRRKAT